MMMQKTRGKQNALPAPGLKKNAFIRLPTDTLQN
jgi:hypothetical protein